MENWSCVQDFKSLVGGRRKTKAAEKQGRAEPEDTTDYVAMETQTWKRARGPVKVDDHPWLHPWHITAHCGERYMNQSLSSIFCLQLFVKTLFQKFYTSGKPSVDVLKCRML